MTYQPLKRSGISEDVARYIMNLIKEKKLKPGDKLPSERELSEALQVSRPSLREGMRTLAFMNILDIRSGDGTYVGSLQPETLVEHMEFVLAIDDSTLLQLVHARQLVEPQLAAEAAIKITAEELQRLNECLRQMRNQEDDLEKLAELDVELHNLIAHATHNPFLARFMVSLRHLGRKSRERTVQIPAIRLQSQIDHEAIVAAISDHDSVKAREAMITHLEHIEAGLRASMKNTPQQSME